MFCKIATTNVFFTIALIEIHLSLSTDVTYLISSLVCRCHEIFTPHLLMIRQWSENLWKPKREESWCVCSLCTNLCFLYIFIFSKTNISCMKTENTIMRKKGITDNYQPSFDQMSTPTKNIPCTWNSVQWYHIGH